MNLQQVNVLLLGAAFHLLFFSFQTSVFIQQTVVNSIKQRPEYNFTGDGYVSLCITYAVFALANWLAPSVIAVTGLKYGMFLGAITYVIYSATFIYPTTWLFYLAAALIGLGAGLLWTAQGGFLSKQSNSSTSSKNAAIFWSMLQSSILFGNLFVYFAFNSQTTISDETRYLVYGVLTLVGALGTLTLLLLRDQQQVLVLNNETVVNNSSTTNNNQSIDIIVTSSVSSQFVRALKLAKTLDMILLSSAFLFTGQLLSFFTGVYGTSVGATAQFGNDSKKYIGLVGIFMGMGEILGGATFGLLGEQVNKRLKRDTVFVFGYVTLVCAIMLTYINLPPDSSLVAKSTLPALIEQPQIWLAMLCATLIGLADACFNTQIYSLLMSVYNHESVGAFALFKFVQSAGSAAAFFYSTKLNLYHQLLLLAALATCATICFCLVEWRSRRASLAEWRRHCCNANDDDDDENNDEKMGSNQNIINTTTSNSDESSASQSSYATSSTSNRSSIASLSRHLDAAAAEHYRQYNENVIIGSCKNNGGRALAPTKTTTTKIDS